MPLTRRSQILIDRKVQGALMRRVAGYWVFCLLSVALMLICWSAYQGPPRRGAVLFAELYLRYAPALIASLIVLPIVMIDVVRLSVRFVGPVQRLKTALRELADGQQTRPLSFRDDDFWRELAEDFNRVAARVPQSMLGRPTEAMPEVEEAEA